MKEISTKNEKLKEIEKSLDSQYKKIENLSNDKKEF